MSVSEPTKLVAESAAQERIAELEQRVATLSAECAILKQANSELAAAAVLPDDCAVMLKSGIEALDIGINQLRDGLRVAMRRLDPSFLFYLQSDMGFNVPVTQKQIDAATIRKALKLLPSEEKVTL